MRYTRKLLLAALLSLTLAMGLAACGGGGSSSDGGGNSAPLANAGPDQNVSTGATVTLDGSGSSDADGDLLAYSWSFTSSPAGSTAALSGSTAVKPTFIADADGAYVLSLVVNDGSVDSAADTVTITAATANSAPVAKAGPDQNVSTGSPVTLDGSGSSDADEDPLAYSWSFTSSPAGSTAALSDPAAVNPTFTANADGAYVLSLVVNDGSVDSAADTVTITAATANSAPVANAGQDQSVLTGATVTLDGSGSSDADQDPLTYSWSFTTRPGASTAALSGSTTANPTFTADVFGDYVLSLVVNDGTVASAADPVTITATASLPDTGQTDSYTDTLGEDSDYTINPPFYTDNSDDTVTDNITGLIWQQSDDDVTRTWDAAGSYCAGLSLAGYTDWRLPTKKELVGIVDYGVYSPAINEITFPGTNASNYWSSTSHLIWTDYAWCVNFNDGYVNSGYSKTVSYHVRCVR